MWSVVRCLVKVSCLVVAFFGCKLLGYFGAKRRIVWNELALVALVFLLMVGDNWLLVFRRCRTLGALVRISGVLGGQPCCFVSQEDDTFFGVLGENSCAIIRPRDFWSVQAGRERSRRNLWRISLFV